MFSTEYYSFSSYFCCLCDFLLWFYNFFFFFKVHSNLKPRRVLHVFTSALWDVNVFTNSTWDVLLSSFLSSPWSSWAGRRWGGGHVPEKPGAVSGSDASWTKKINKLFLQENTRRSRRTSPKTKQNWPFLGFCNVVNSLEDSHFDTFWHFVRKKFH